MRKLCEVARKPNAHVVRGIDHDGFYQLLTERLETLASRLEYVAQLQARLASA